PGPMGGGGGGPRRLIAVGRDDVQVDTLAGEVPGYEDGPGWRARFCGPSALALAPDGSLLVADSRNHPIRRVTRTGSGTTVAGGGPAGGPGGSGDGPAAESRFRYPCGVAVAKDGSLYVADTGNQRVCRVKDGQVSTLAGSEEGKADGTGAAARFRNPAALAWGPENALWVVDTGNRALRRVDLAGHVTTPPPPPEVVAQLGETGTSAHQGLSSSSDGLGPAQPSGFRMGRRGPGARGAG